MVASQGTCQTLEILFPFSCPYTAKQSLQNLPCAVERGENHLVGPFACPLQHVRKA